jgi:hypothetical protein
MTDDRKTLDAMTDADLKDFADRYVAVWNEPDPARRHAAVRELWTADVVHALPAPAEMRERASRFGFDDLLFRATGHERMEIRVARSYEEFVAPGGHHFRLRDVARVAGMVSLNWEMVARPTGEVAATGLEVLLLAPDGRIATDYQFPGA